MLHSSIETRGSEVQGLGLFATAHIAAGTVVWSLEPDTPRLTAAEVEQMPDDDRNRFLRHAFEVDTDVWAGYPDGNPGDPSVYMNHSCEPTTWFEGLALLARVDIEPDDEVTYDYSTSEASPDFRMPCRCSSSRCRTTVTGDDWRIHPEMRAFYGSHALAHVRATAIGAD